MGALENAIYGAISGAVTFGIGSAVGGIGNQLLKATVQAVAHGVFQGGMSWFQRGDFVTGFASGALSSLASSAFGWDGNGKGNEGLGWASDFRSSAGGKILFGAIAGGAGAALTKGNFWQGAVIGAMVAGLNHVMHDFAKTITVETLVNKELKKMGWGYDKGCKLDYSEAQVREMIALSPELKRLMNLSGNNAKFNLTGKVTINGGYGYTNPNSNPPLVGLGTSSFISPKSLFITLGHELNHAWHIYKPIDSTGREQHSVYNEWGGSWNRLAFPEALSYDWEMLWDHNSESAINNFNREMKNTKLSDSKFFEYLNKYQRK